MLDKYPKAFGIRKKDGSLRLLEVTKRDELWSITPTEYSDYLFVMRSEDYKDWSFISFEDGSGLEWHELKQVLDVIS